jgi:hypothetical protein
MQGQEALHPSALSEPAEELCTLRLLLPELLLLPVSQLLPGFQPELPPGSQPELLLPSSQPELPLLLSLPAWIRRRQPVKAPSPKRVLMK